MSQLIPLTVLEKFLYWEDRPAYPWCAFCKFEFDGPLDRDAFQRAATDALQRHVLLRSKIVARGKRLYWQPVRDAVAPIHWNDTPRASTFPKLKHIDLENEIGLQLVAVCRGEKTDLVFGGHHASADALGGASYARDVFINYANLTSNSIQPIDLPELNHAELMRRGRFGMGWKKFLRQLPMQMVGLAGARQFVKRKPAPLVPHHAVSDPLLADGYPHVLTAELDPETTNSVRERAKSQDCTLNDLLARDLFLAINAWRMSRGGARDDWVRMMIPMNVRTRETRNLPATNFVSSVFLDRRGGDFENPASLLQSIKQEMNLIKDNNLGMTFLYSLKLLNMLPGRLKQQATADRCTNSCIFSNLDRHFLRLPFPRRQGKLVIGNLELQKAWTIAPLRPYSLASFMSLVYDGRLLLTLHYDGRFIEEEAAQQLLQFWGRHIGDAAPTLTKESQA